MAKKKFKANLSGIASKLEKSQQLAQSKLKKTTKKTETPQKPKVVIPKLTALVIDVNQKTKSQLTGEESVAHVLIEVVGDFKIGDKLEIGR